MESHDKDEPIETRLVQVRGQVQGIGHREACVRRATALGVTGWVRNRVDGSVEAMLQGSPEQLAEMCAWLSEGMSAALSRSLSLPRCRHRSPALTTSSVCRRCRCKVVKAARAPRGPF
jgi:acylphosphatase